MNLENYYYYFVGELSQSFCDDLITYGKSLKENKALVGNEKNDISELNDKELLELNKTRNSNVSWLRENWIYKEIHPFIHEANNRAGWNFQWDWSEPCQFTKYDVGQYYGWHCDSFKKPYENHYIPELNGKTRKLSATISLSHPDEYEGGELEFDFRNYNDPHDINKRNEVIRQCEEIKPRGSIVVFPSHVWHRVKPVTKGTRYSLVIWSCGNPYI